MNDRGSSLFILFLGDPHRLKCREHRHHRTSNQHRKISFLRSKNFNLCILRCKGFQLLVQSFLQTWEHRCPSTQYDIWVQIFSEICVRLEDWFGNRFVNTKWIYIDKFGIKEGFSTSKLLISHTDVLAVRKLILRVILVWVLIL